MVENKKNSEIMKQTFGILKRKLIKSTDELMKEVDRELWNEV